METVTLWSRQAVSVVGAELVDRPYPEGGGQWLLFKRATCHKWGPPGTDIGP